jgi:hypothetical protein
VFSSHSFSNINTMHDANSQKRTFGRFLSDPQTSTTGKGNNNNTVDLHNIFHPDSFNIWREFFRISLHPNYVHTSISYDQWGLFRLSFI